MPDEQLNAGEQQNEQQGEANKSAGKYNPKTVEDALNIITSLEKRLGERDSDLEKIKSDLKKQEKARQDDLAKQGNFQTLAEQHAAEVARLKPIEEYAATLDKHIRTSNEERIKTIPDNKKPLVQVLVDKLSPLDMQTYLNTNPTLFVKEDAPQYDGGKGGNGSPPPNIKLSPDEKAMAKRMGVTEEEYMKVKARREK